MEEKADLADSTVERAALPIEFATLVATAVDVCLTVSVTTCMNSLDRMSASASRYDVRLIDDMRSGPSAAVSQRLAITPTRNTRNALTRPSAVAPMTIPPARAPAPPPMSCPMRSLKSESSMPPIMSALIITRVYKRARPRFVGLKPQISTMLRTKSRQIESMVTVVDNCYLTSKVYSHRSKLHGDDTCTDKHDTVWHVLNAEHVTAAMNKLLARNFEFVVTLARTKN